MIMIEIKCMLGKRIKELREKRGLTQQELSELAGIDQRNLSKIECGVNFVSSETLEKLSSALNVPIKDLFDFDHLNEDTLKKEELISSIQNNIIDIDLLYKIYLAIKK